MRTYTRSKRQSPRHSSARYSHAESARHRHTERPAKRRRSHATQHDKEKTRARDENHVTPQRSSSTVPSSPPLNDDFSRGSSDVDTPPSSPPSLQPSRSQNPPSTMDSLPSSASKMFSKEPLRETSGNRRKKPTTEPKKRLVQMQIDLGGEKHRTCRECGMGYIPSNSDDIAAHEIFHKRNNDGIVVSKAFTDASRTRKIAEIGQLQHVVAVSRSDPKVMRNQAQEVLQIANGELGSVNLREQDLWGPQSEKTRKRRMTDSLSEDEDRPVHVFDSTNGKAERDRFKLYLLLRNKKCVGVCLAENISKSHKVVKLDEKTQILQAPQAKGSAIAVSRDTDSALLGISRIWTSKAHRNEGVATALLDCAAENFLYGMKIPKDQVAFSQPTESGGRLARKWFGREYGWHVYVD